MDGGQKGGSSEPVMPLVMPVYPAQRTNLCHHVAPPAYSPERNQLKDECRYRCSWRLATACLAVLSVLLLALMAYFAATGGGGGGAERYVEHAVVMAPPDSTRHVELTTASVDVSDTAADTPSRASSPVSPRTPPPVPAPSRLTPGAAVVHQLAPHELWTVEHDVNRPQVMNLTVTAPLSASLAVYGRRNAAPRVTQHEFGAFVRAGALERSARVLSRRTGRSPFGDELLENVTLIEHLEPGRWFVAVLNDGEATVPVQLAVQTGEPDTLRCPSNCSGRGSCRRGECTCRPGYTGPDCATSVCPVLCSNHGSYSGGRCHCVDGWKGAECDLPATDCVIADCHRHGVCRLGRCECAPGWKGEFCQTADCADPTCSGHGVCTEGVCVCLAGWVGSACQQPDERIRRCLPDCSGHGVFDLSRDRCLCDEMWTGPECAKPRCNLDCGPHGSCQAGDCVCDPGWNGQLCDLRTCDPRCSEHGQCKNGTCVCLQGWNGQHCSIPGCPGGCSGRGSCVKTDGWYGCVCATGWDGVNCSIPLEMDCRDGIDNDGDGMKDCSDSECCWDSNCQNSLMCLISPEPVDVLLRKQPARQTASFYQRVKFLIEEKSVQDYADKDEYSERRVSVIRGRLVTSQGLGIAGVRVSVNRDTRFGLTLSRKNGWFDIMVNGGGAVNLQFQRAPFRPMTRPVAVAWNQLVVLDPIVMLQDTERPAADASTPPPACHTHQPDLLRPVIINTWQPDTVIDADETGDVDGAAVLVETQVLQESIEIPGTGLRLVYNSQDASGYHSTLLMRLTADPVPETLVLVHLKVIVEGTVFTQTFESDPNITYSYSWNKRNVYEQKVYGMAQAHVSVGYEYSDCAAIMWDTRVLPIPGFRMDISDIGGWNLDIHHMYNFHEGILQRGDGSSVHFKRHPRLVDTLLGTGQQRPLRCPPASCSGAANASRLLTPVALATGADGSVYVGDFNLVRRVTPAGEVFTVAELRATQVSYNYYMAMSPVEQKLYISDPEAHQVFKVIQMEQVADPSKNLERVAGTGDRCLPGDDTSCGDGRPAVDAKLSHPKGLAVSADRVVYLADGTNIRTIDANGIISTLIGHHGHKSVWRPIPCSGSLPLAEAQPQWPTAMALSPVDGTLHFLDDRLVLRLTPDGKLQVRAGRPPHCPRRPDAAASSPLSPLGTLIDLAFDADGALYLAEADAGKVHYVRRLDGSGRLTVVAGALPACHCEKDQCACEPVTGSGAAGELATRTHLTSVSALAAGPDGSLHVADQGALKILRLRHNLPEEGPGFKVIDPVLNKVYGFNRFGQHVETKDLLTGRSVYLFQYSKNTSFGRLSKITDWSGNSVQLVRDYSNVVSSIQNSQGERCTLHHMARVGLVTNFTTSGNKYHFEYDPETELLRCRSDSRGDVFLYDYDTTGRLEQALTSTGERLKLESRLVAPQHLQVTVARDDKEPFVVNIDNAEQSTTYTYGEMSTVVQTLANNTIVLSEPGETDTYVTFTKIQQMSLLYSPPVQTLDSAVSQRRLVREDMNYPRLENELRLSMAPLQGNQMHGFLVTRTLQSNGSEVLSVDYDPVTLRQTVYTPTSETAAGGARQVALSVKYKESVKPDTWSPAGLPQMFVSYDSIGRLEQWRWGELTQQFSYGSRSGLTRRQTDTTSDSFTYDPNNQPATFTLPSGRQFEYHYDSRGGLQFIITPNRSRHFLHVQPSLGYVKFQYVPPGGSQQPWVRRYSQDGRLLLSQRPGLGATVHRYDGAGRRTATATGDGETQYRYSPGGQLDRVLHSERYFGFRLELSHQGPLERERRLKFDPDTGLSSAVFRYEYDSRLRPTRISGRVGGRRLTPLHLRYDPTTGQLSQLGPLTISRPRANQTILSSDGSLLSLVRDRYGRDAGLTLTVSGREVHRRRWERDAAGRLTTERIWRPELAGRPVTRTLQYGPDGELTADNAEDSWSFEYDRNGNLVELRVKHSNISLEVDQHDRLVRLGGRGLRHDSAGGVVQNFRDDSYRYDARGLLSAVAKQSGLEVRYYYDERLRLVARKDTLGNITQFFYGDPRHEQRATHIYRPRSDQLTEVLYDELARPVLVRAADRQYTVVADACGSPQLLYDRRGRLVREVSRTAFGHPVSDSWPGLYLPVDFCGGLWDSATELLHMPGGRVYDPFLGQWLTPDVDGFVRNLMNPRRLHLYRFNGNDPINVRRQDLVPSDEAGWLARLGYRVDRLAPQLTLDPSVFGPAPSEAGDGPCLTSLRPVSGQLGRLRRLLLTPRRLGLISRVPEMTLRRQPEPEQWPRRVSSQPGPLGAGVILAVSGGHVTVRGLPSVDPIAADVLSTVFAGAQLLNITGHHHGRDVFHFVKPALWSFSEDAAQLTRLAQFNVTEHKPSSISGELGRRPSHVVGLRIETPHSVLNVHYGTTAAGEQRHLVHHARRVAKRAAWSHERQLLLHRLSSRPWSASEREKIIAREGVAGMEYSFRHEPDQYPELAADLFNVRFGRAG
ncbi:teneurin-m-like isoform X2 [Amphibalanus amphitrite]|uniref:teneurin-m-like isoform X2 n=1 Tax=Amphibalanus amphitrite TaxID=1232801 RepID=UPI001C927225|nr:teneurin-m-like isoform X2 [Amphibalanus amphitrite]